jgi:crotonobetainyl-CoA:carnitine CoA-transferase CaiB-like acyl-CoA transferase
MRLDGIRVVDLTVSLAGPFCTQLLGALGADVVKIERPDGGDETRAWGPPFVDGMGVLFLSANANKRSLALDLRRPAAVEAVLRLVDRADVFVQSLRPGVAESYGLGAGELTGRNPRLVYCSIGAFGGEGPLASQPGYDPLMQAFAGIMSLTGEPDGPPVRVGTSVVDQTTGLWAAIGILLALAEREATGRGGVVDVSLFESAITLVPYQLLSYLVTGEVPQRTGTAFPLIAPYQAFRTSDGELMVTAGNDRLFRALCEALAVPPDPRFATNPDRVAHREELVELLSARFREETSATWLERLATAGVPAAPVQDVGRAAEHEQTRALELLQALDGLTAVRPALTLDGQRVGHRMPPPALGAHSADVLREVGYGDEEIDSVLGHGPAR